MRARGVVGAVALAVGIGLASPAAAQAAPSCPTGKVCSWSGTGFVGSSGWINPPTRCDSTSYGAITDRRSAVNNSTVWVVFWEQGSCAGRMTLVRPGAAVADFGFTAVAVSPLAF